MTADHTIARASRPTAGPADLVGWCEMDGDVTDASGNGYNATAVGSPTYVTGVDGQALSLNGTSQYASVPHNAALQHDQRDHAGHLGQSGPRGAPRT